MDINFSHITYFSNIDNLVLNNNAEQFLMTLDGLTVIDIAGIDSTRCRVAISLIHGDESAGFLAMYQWLKEYQGSQALRTVPPINLRFIICSPEAAQFSPLFSKRYLPGAIDLNRCFGKNSKCNYYLRAQLIEQAIRDVSPEAVIDFHNTPGNAPAFAVSALDDNQVISLTSIFCSTLILSEIKIGALVEQNFNCPSIVIESGGKGEQKAVEIAYQGLIRFCSYNTLIDCQLNKPVEIIHTPLRLQVKQGTSVHYQDINNGSEGIVLLDKIEHFNYGVTKRGQSLGWLNNCGLEHLALIDAENEDVITDYFSLQDKQLVCATDMRIFMAATDHKLAQKDCVFYLVKQRDVARSNIPDIDYLVQV